MIKHNPRREYMGAPCSITAVGCASGVRPGEVPPHPNGYMSLRDMNKLVRKYCLVRKYVYFKQTERVKLKQLHLTGRAVVCVEGHYLYVDKEEYWSFFYNEEDPVVAVWILKDQAPLRNPLLMAKTESATYQMTA
jgi:hypothetical protein